MNTLTNNLVCENSPEVAKAFQHYRKLLLQKLSGNSLNVPENAFVAYIENNFYGNHNTRINDGCRDEQTKKQVVYLYRALFD